MAKNNVIAQRRKARMEARKAAATQLADSIAEPAKEFKTPAKKKKSSKKKGFFRKKSKEEDQ